MRRLIIADSHVGQSEGDARAMCRVIERASRRGIDEIIYLGDSFQYLIGMAKFWSPAVREVLGCWDFFHSKGGRIVLIEGNRDFFLGEEDLAPHIDHAAEVYEFRAGDQFIRLVHGDRVNEDDRQYLFWARVSKSRPAWMFARLLPRRIAVWIVESMEERLARSNKKYRYTKPVDDLRKAACSAWDEGVTLLLWGHFHSFWHIEDGGRLAMVVPAWLDHSTMLLVEENGEWAFVDNELNAMAVPEKAPERERCSR